MAESDYKKAHIIPSNFVVKQGDRVIFYMTHSDKGYTIPSPGGPTILSQEELDMIIKATGFTTEEITDEEAFLMKKANDEYRRVSGKDLQAGSDKYNYFSTRIRSYLRDGSTFDWKSNFRLDPTEGPFIQGVLEKDKSSRTLPSPESYSAASLKILDDEIDKSSGGRIYNLANKDDSDALSYVISSTYAKATGRTDIKTIAGDPEVLNFIRIWQDKAQGKTLAKEDENILNTGNIHLRYITDKLGDKITYNPEADTSNTVNDYRTAYINALADYKSLGRDVSSAATRFSTVYSRFVNEGDGKQSFDDWLNNLPNEDWDNILSPQLTEEEQFIKDIEMEVGKATSDPRVFNAIMGYSTEGGMSLPYLLGMYRFKKQSNPGLTAVDFIKDALPDTIKRVSDDIAVADKEKALSTETLQTQLVTAQANLKKLVSDLDWDKYAQATQKEMDVLDKKSKEYQVLKDQLDLAKMAKDAGPGGLDELQLENLRQSIDWTKLQTALSLEQRERDIITFGRQQVVWQQEDIDRLAKLEQDKIDAYRSGVTFEQDTELKSLEVKKRIFDLEQDRKNAEQEGKEWDKGAELRDLTNQANVLKAKLDIKTTQTALTEADVAEEDKQDFLDWKDFLIGMFPDKNEEDLVNVINMFQTYKNRFKKSKAPNWNDWLFDNVKVGELAPRVLTQKEEEAAAAQAKADSAQATLDAEAKLKEAATQGETDAGYGYIAQLRKWFPKATSLDAALDIFSGTGGVYSDYLKWKQQKESEIYEQKAADMMKQGKSGVVKVDPAEIGVDVYLNSLGPDMFRDFITFPVEKTPTGYASDLGLTTGGGELLPKQTVFVPKKTGMAKL